MGDRLSSLGDDNFFALTDAIEELDDVSGGFGEGDVGDHRVDLLCGRSIIICGCSIINCEGRAIDLYTSKLNGFMEGKVDRQHLITEFALGCFLRGDSGVRVPVLFPLFDRGFPIALSCIEFSQSIMSIGLLLEAGNLERSL